RLFTATLEHDGQTEELRTLQVAVGNGRFYGGGMTVHADATATDGMLDFYSLEVDHWWRLLKLLPSIRKGTHGNWNDVRSFSTKDLTIRTSKPRAVNLDGELKTNTPVKFSIREKAISVFVP
ncbi:MAG: lipid kinase, partial [Hoeflea sp.]|nr:lipid kinase [Hoeflea sp.]